MKQHYSNCWVLTSGHIYSNNIFWPSSTNGTRHNTNGLTLLSQALAGSALSTTDSPWSTNQSQTLKGVSMHPNRGSLTYVDTIPFSGLKVVIAFCSTLPAYTKLLLPLFTPPLTPSCGKTRHRARGQDFRGYAAIAQTLCWHAKEIASAHGAEVHGLAVCGESDAIRAEGKGHVMLAVSWARIDRFTPYGDEEAQFG